MRSGTTNGGRAVRSEAILFLVGIERWTFMVRRSPVLHKNLAEHTVGRISLTSLC